MEINPDTTNRFRPLGADFGLNAGYDDVTGAHLAASLSALEELASLVSTQTSPSRSGQHVRLSLFDHEGFLNQLLFGFAVHLSLDRVITPPAAPLLPPPRPGHAVQGPATSPDLPLLYAVVANHPVEVQIQHTLAFLARLISRRAITNVSVSTSIDNIDRRGSELDAEADQEMANAQRADGWRAAAAALRVRAQASGEPLLVSVGRTLLTPEQIKLQVPIVRRVYNESDSVRRAVNILVTLMSQGMAMAGGGNAEIAGFIRDHLDLGLNRTFMAHVVRDAYVCGNGYLVYGPVPDEDMRLLPPEVVTVLDDGNYEEETPGGPIIHRAKHVMHVKGATQAHSRYGVSLLEPLVALQAHREIADEIISQAIASDDDRFPPDWRQYTVRRKPLGERIAAQVERDTEAILGPSLATNSLGVVVPEDLYFRGFEVLAPAAQGIAIAGPLSGEVEAES